HVSLAYSLLQQGRLDDAEVAYRSALHLNSQSAEIHYSLGNVLGQKHNLADAIVAYDQAICLKPDYAEAHFNRGLTLRRTGQFADALAALQRAHELGSRNPNWRLPSAQGAREMERLIELERKLPEALLGNARITDATEMAGLAEVCLLKRL